MKNGQRMISRPTIFILALFAFVQIGCGYAPITEPRRFNPSNEPTLVPTSEAVAKPVYTIEQGLVTERLTFDARVSPRFETAVLSPISGTILDLDVVEGDFVSAGDRLARFDFSPVEQELTDLLAEIETKQTELGIMATQQKDVVDLAQVELDIALLDLELAEQRSAPVPTAEEAKQIELLSLKVELAQKDFEKASATIDPDGVLADEINALLGEVALLEEQRVIRTIVSPADGTVLGLAMQSGRRVEIDQTVAVVGNMGDVDDVSVSAVLRSDDLERLADGMAASLVFDSRPDESYPASIVRLPYPFNSGGNNLGFDSDDKAVRILPDDAGLLDQFAPGEQVEVTIVVDQNEMALWLPSKAIREFSGRTFIVVRVGEREQRIDIETGLRGDERVEIIGSVEAGQEVIGP